MGTRARIGMRNTDGTITSIYTHWDGYPGHHWPILTRHYTTVAEVIALLALGDLSVLAERLGEKHDFDSRGADMHQSWCCSYSRDRNEEDTGARTHGSDWPDYGQEYEYLYEGGRWLWRPQGQEEWNDSHQEAA